MRGMKTYKVVITEKLQMTVEVEANSRSEAAEIAEHNWHDSQYILDSEHFKGARFDVVIPERKRQHER
jgi:hypothetical protein